MRRAAACLGLLLFCCLSARAEDRPVENNRYSLFDGSNLDRWSIAGCEADIVDGCLRLKAGDGIVRTLHTFRDFTLELEWKPLAEDNWDSGIYFRAALPPEGKAWPSKHQINLKKGDEGNLIGNKDARSSGLVNAKEWNRFKLTVVGSTAELEINGKPAWKAENIEPAEGFILFQSEVPLGGQHLFRNIEVTELGYKSLFNGRDLTGWELSDSSTDPVWIVEDGIIRCTGKRGPWLRSAEDYGDFNLKLDYQINAAGNSGVYCRVPINGGHHGPNSGVEVQLLDDSHPRYAKLKPQQFSAGLYDFVGPSKSVSLPVEGWNALEIDCKADRYRVKHNGHLVIDASAKEFPGLGERRKSGRLGFQNHGGKVGLRNIRIGQALGE